MSLAIDPTIHLHYGLDHLAPCPATSGPCQAVFGEPCVYGLSSECMAAAKRDLADVRTATAKLVNWARQKPNAREVYEAVPDPSTEDLEALREIVKSIRAA